MLNKPKIYIFKIIIQSYFKSIMQTLLQYMYSTCLNESHIKKKETFQRVRYAIILTNWKGNMLRKWSVFCGSPCTGNRHSLIKDTEQPCTVSGYKIEMFTTFLEVDRYTCAFKFYLSTIIITNQHKTMNKSVLTSSWKGMRRQTLKQNQECRHTYIHTPTYMYIHSYNNLFVALYCYKIIQRMKLILKKMHLL